MNNSNIHRHVIAALVANEPGVLAQVAGMFAARGFNIDSLVVGHTENPDLSRMTIVVVGSNSVLEQIQKQLMKLVPVIKVVVYNEVSFVERDLVLISVSTQRDGSDTAARSEIIELTEMFRGNIVDVGQDRLMVELEGGKEKLEAYIELLRPFGILELARTGAIAMARGDGRPPISQSGAIRPQGPAKDIGPQMDPADLPPG